MFIDLYMTLQPLMMARIWKKLWRALPLKGEHRIFWGILSSFGNQHWTRKTNIHFYDKRDYFPYLLVKMPHLKNTIPSKMFYSAFF